MKIRNKKEMDYISDRPFQKERLNEERLHNLGIDLSNIHIISDQKKSTDLKEKLLENRDIIEEEYNFLAKGEKIKLDHPGIDWILDNYYIIIDQIKDLIHSLSKTYLNELPQLSNGKYPNIPRIYELVHELLAHSDSYVNRSNLESFFTGYQENVNLTIGEIWMIPLSLRICLVENIKRIIKKVTYIKREYVKAENWINKVKTYYREEPEKIILSLADLVKNNFKISEIFICEIYKKLENFGLDFALSWLDFFLKSKGENIEEVIYNINQEQGEERIIVANCLTTLREISTFEWNDIIEGLSKVDKELSKDPVNIYKNMDFNTRDRYRHSIEDISKRYNIEEIDIAKKAREMALKNYEDRSKEDAKSHVGYYLIDDGKWELIKHLKKG